MAGALRNLCRLTAITRAADGLIAPSISQIQTKRYKYSEKIKIQHLDLTKLPEFEISRDEKEWEYVERLLPIKIVPKPKEFDGPAPSGWIPPRPEEALKLPYFVTRTKNHMLPIYLNIDYRGMRRVTKIKKIDGDIWKLEAELRKYLETKITKKSQTIASRVHELTGQIVFRGDYVEYVKKWMFEKGF